LALLPVFFLSCGNSKSVDNKSDRVEIKKHIRIKPGPEKGKDSTFGLFDPQFSNHEAPYIDGFAWTILGVNAVCRSVFEFDLSFLNRNIKVDSALLSLYAIDPAIQNIETHEGNFGENAFKLLRITSDWKENEVNWINQPNTTYKNHKHFEKIQIQYADLLHVNVTDMINDMLLDGENNLGLLMKLDHEEIYSVVLFASSDYADSTKHPELDIYYSEVE
jgi:hypothetical protein